MSSLWYAATMQLTFHDFLCHLLKHVIGTCLILFPQFITLILEGEQVLKGTPGHQARQAPHLCGGWRTNKGEPG